MKPETLIIFLTEVIIFELIFIIILSFSIYKIKKFYNTLREKYLKLKRTIKAGTTVDGSVDPSIITLKSASDDKQSDNGDSTAIDAYQYLLFARDSGIERFKTNTNSSSLSLRPNHPFSAQIAALRGMYMQAECDAYLLKDNPYKQWLELEKSLRKILLNCLPKSESKNIGYTDFNTNGLTQIGKINNTLKNITTGNKLNKDQTFEIEDLKNLVSNTYDVFDKINKINNDKLTASQRLKEKIPQNVDINEAQKEYFFVKIQKFEAEIKKSDDLITFLKENIRQLEEIIEQKTSTPDTPIGTKPDSHPLFVKTKDKENNSFDLDDYNLDKDTTNEAIKQQQENNAIQRAIIVELESKLAELTHELDEITDLNDVVTDKDTEIDRLEQYIRESNGCILTLESEINLLHSQLEDGRNSPTFDDDTADEQQHLQVELNETNELLKTATHLYEKQSIISDFSIKSAHCNSIDDIIDLLLETLRNLNLMVGIHIRSNSRTDEFFPSKQFSNNEIYIAREKTSPSGKRLTVLEHSTLIHHPLISALIKADSDNKPEKIKLLTTLIDISANTIERIDNTETVQRQKQIIEKFVSSTQKIFSNIEIKSAYKAEESEKIFLFLEREINHLEKILPPSSNIKFLLDSALMEAKERMKLLNTSSTTEYTSFQKVTDKIQHYLDKGMI